MGDISCNPDFFVEWSLMDTSQMETKLKEGNIQAAQCTESAAGNWLCCYLFIYFCKSNSFSFPPLAVGQPKDQILSFKTWWKMTRVHFPFLLLHPNVSHLHQC